MLCFWKPFLLSSWRFGWIGKRTSYWQIISTSSLHRNQFNELLRIPASFTFIIHRVVYNLSKGIVNSSTLQSYCIPFIRKQDDLLCRKGILNVLNVSTDYTIFNDLTTLARLELFYNSVRKSRTQAATDKVTFWW